MQEKDYYQILGVARNANAEELKKRIEKKHFNITRIKIQMILVQQKNLKRLPKHMKF